MANFYGKRNRNTLSSFIFDKVYPTRRMAELYADNDGVFVGRFVLIDYNSEENKAYDTIPNFADVEEAPTEGLIAKTDADTYQVYSNGEWVDIELKYETLFHLDKNFYNGDRAYDSTVWRKVINSEGKGIYAMVAELNSVLPTMKLTLDAPSDETGLAPYYDEDSTDISYHMHMPTSWGFRVKEAKADPEGSDGIASLTDDGELAIYYNKSGLDSKNIAYAPADAEDEITVKSTGKSGNTYGGDEPVEDIKELAILLPSIGDTMAKVWDLTYGDEALNGGTERNQHTAWDDTYSGLRLVTYDGEGKYAYNTDQVATIAGALNSTHDALGKIIRTYIPGETKMADGTTILTLDKMSDDRIYYIPSDYTGNDYLPSRYYYRYTYYTPSEVAGENIIFSDGANQVPSPVYKPISENTVLIDINNLSNLYTYEDGNYYAEDENKYEPYKDYVSLTAVQAETGAPYQPGLYYTASVEHGTLVYTPYEEENAPDLNDVELYKLKAIQLPNLRYLYAPNKYFICDDSALADTYDAENWNGHLATEAYNPEQIYYVGHKTKIRNDDGVVQGYASYTKLSPNMIDEYADNTYFTLENNKYIELGEAVSDNPINLEWVVYKIQATQINRYYEANKYYLLSDDKNYILSTAENCPEEDLYELQNITSVGDEVFEPNKYYVQTTNNVYELAETYTPNTTYYERYDWYVAEDKPPYRKGMKWTQDTIPAGLTLCLMNKQYKLIELKGFARTYNTIHGSLLGIHRELEDGEDGIDGYNSRVPGTVRGEIQLMRDQFIDTIEAMKNDYDFSALSSPSVLVKIPNETSSNNPYTGTVVGVEIGGDDNWINVEFPASDNDTIDISHKTLNGNAPIETHNSDASTEMVSGLTVDGAGHVTEIIYSPSSTGNFLALREEDYELDMETLTAGTGFFWNGTVVNNGEGE